MVTLAHLSGGYLVLKSLNKLKPGWGLSKRYLMIIGLVGAILPDVDFVFFKYVKDHHNSWWHTPFFWLVIYGLILILGLILKKRVINKIGTVLIIGVATHLFLDWFSGRTAGIRIWYPLSEKMFSLYPLNPSRGEIPTSLWPNKEYVSFFKFYAQNKVLLLSEIGLTVSGIILAVINVVK